MTLCLSLGELEAQARYAARGAGYHWGHADEAAAGVRWLESMGLPGTACLAARLRRIAATDVRDFRPAVFSDSNPDADTTFCAICTGSALLDRARELPEQVAIHQLEDPLLLLPALQELCRHLDTTVTLEWQHHRQRVQGYFHASGVCGVLGDRPALTCAVTPQVSVGIGVTDTSFVSEALLPCDRAYVTAEDWQALATFAARTRAPATEQSRQLGAGAGNNDAN